MSQKGGRIMEEQERRVTLTVPPEAGRIRLDRFLGEALRNEDVSREKVKRAIRDGGCRVDGDICLETSLRLGAGQYVELILRMPPSSVSPEAGDLSILYQDAYLAVVNKPAGLTVHPAPSCPEGTLVHRLVAHFPSLREQEGFRPGIVHRLDKDTSGLICVALTEEARLRLSGAFAAREVRKEYLALVQGDPPATGIVDEPLGRHPSIKVKVAVVKNGKPARSEWRVLHRGPGYALLAVRIHTGRTHQIRVHMAFAGYPLWGDALYGRGGQALVPPVSGTVLTHDPAPRQMLHAWKLSFTHPFTGENMSFCCPPPEDFLQTVQILNRRMRRVVVTGAAGSGKSLFVHTLKELGVPVWSADEAVIRLYEPGQEAWQALRRRYGDRFVPDAHTPVDRRRLAAALLPGEGGSAPELDVHELNALLHPLVWDDLERFWEEQERAGRGFAVAEVPLWFETGWGSGGPLSDGGRRDVAASKPFLVGVYCDENERRRRLLDVRGWTEEMMRKMDALQWSQERKMAGCHLVIPNLGTPEELRARTQAFLRQMEGWDDEDSAAFAARWKALVDPEGASA